LPRSSFKSGATALSRTPIVSAPDIILDLIYDRSDWADDAMRLFDAIAADVERDRQDRPAYIAPITVPTVYLLAQRSAGIPVARQVTGDLMRLLHVAPMNNYDYFDALSLFRFDYEDALQFVTCRCVGSKFLVTRNSFDRKRTPVHRRTAAEILPLFRK
jgi:hypothetical protein